MLYDSLEMVIRYKHWKIFQNSFLPLRRNTKFLWIKEITIKLIDFLIL